MNDAEEEDWLLKFLSEFASMPEDDRDAAIEALSAERRDALVAFAEARETSAGANLIDVLDAGHGGLEKLHEATQPADLLTVINLAIKERPNIVAEALFAAVVVHRGWTGAEPPAIAALREQWIWHVHELIQAAREGDADDRAEGD
jgi:hypothetical protein